MLKNTSLLCLLIALTLYSHVSVAQQFSAKTDTQFRFDDRSGKKERYQYRVRFYPQLSFGEFSEWSVNAFAATGDEFSSSHNTIDEDVSDHFYVRRFYLRHQQGEGKTEVGIIPTYKGRVSSTGLSKDGWIAGIRQVVGLENGKFELVLGDLADVAARHALELPDKLSYVELEYSSDFIGQFAYEVSAERLLESNFLTAEVRYKSNSDVVYAIEVINRLQNSETKIIASAEGSFEWLSREVGFFSYYSYSDEDFGPRDELTEDFLASGHGISIELESTFSDSSPLEWFTRVEVVQSNSRFMIGVKYPFHF